MMNFVQGLLLGLGIGIIFNPLISSGLKKLFRKNGGQ